MFGTLKTLGIIGAVAGASAVAQPALADGRGGYGGGHRGGGFSLGIGFNVRPSRTVVVGPQYYTPNYVATPAYGLGYSSYYYGYQPNYYYVPPVYYAPPVVYYNNYYVPYERQQQRLTFGLIGRW